MVVHMMVNTHKNTHTNTHTHTYTHTCPHTFTRKRCLHKVQNDGQIHVKQMTTK